MTAPVLTAVLVLLLLLAAVLLAAAYLLVRHHVASQLAEQLRHYAARTQAFDPISDYPPGIRHAADLIDPSRRNR